MQHLSMASTSCHKVNALPDFFFKRGKILLNEKRRYKVYLKETKINNFIKTILNYNRIRKIDI